MKNDDGKTRDREEESVNGELKRSAVGMLANTILRKCHRMELQWSPCSVANGMDRWGIIFQLLMTFHKLRVMAKYLSGKVK